MANIITLQFNNQINVNTGKLNYTGNDLDNNDITYWIGSNGFSQAYSNVRVSGEVVASSLLDNAWTKDTATDGGIVSTTADWGFTNYVVLPSSITLAIRGSSTSGTRDIQFEAKNDDGDYEIIGIFPATNLGTPYARISFPIDNQFWTKDFRFSLTAGDTLIIDEIYMYGSFRREDNSSLGSFPANGTIEDVKDSILNNSSVTGPIDYQASLSSKPNIIQTADRRTLSGDLTLDNLANHIILSCDPNGSSRNVILPQQPRLDHYLKIINVDGSFPINIRETVGGPIIEELSNANSVLALEAIWESTDSIWHITS